MGPSRIRVHAKAGRREGGEARRRGGAERAGFSCGARQVPATGRPGADPLAVCRFARAGDAGRGVTTVTRPTVPAR